MQNELKAVATTVTAMQRVNAETDKYLSQIRELGERIDAQAKALWAQHTSGELTYEEYNERMGLIEEVQHVEGERLEKAHIAAMKSSTPR